MAIKSGEEDFVYFSMDPWDWSFTVVCITYSDHLFGTTDDLFDIRIVYGLRNGPNGRIPQNRMKDTPTEATLLCNCLIENSLH